MALLAFPASRSEGLNRLSQFLPRAGMAYAMGRNTDLSPDEDGAVSKLSPYLRYRAITEQEVVAELLGQHDLRAAEKFIQEVLWRTYWKGWLEMRPSVWARFLDERDRQREIFPDQRAIRAAEAGQTGIEGFDYWARELVQNGYLHNHARMWFASIWIFTLRLPWVLGADYFLRHLIDADAASNTLSWRWVAGLQTVGKSYLATTENIARYTNGRFAPSGLAKEAIPLTEPPIAQPAQLREPKAYDRMQPTMLLITHEDFHPESVFVDPSAITSIIVAADKDLLWGDNARRFALAAAHETASRTANHFQCDVSVIERLVPDALLNAAQSFGIRRIVTPYAPVGPVAERLASIAPVLAQEGILLTEQRRLWDRVF